MLDQIKRHENMSKIVLNKFSNNLKIAETCLLYTVTGITDDFCS